MKIIRFFLVALVTLSIFFILNFKWGATPPLGKFLDPFNGFWQNAESTTVAFNAEITSSKISDAVQIKFDERLVPHIFATNDYDLYFAQGFVTAQHRLWQMETQTMFASGRLAEILGPTLLSVDREQRRQGMVYGAENALKIAMADSVASLMLKAYSDGFNHYLNSLSYKDLPLEYKILDYKPEEWSPLKTCLLLKYMAKDLAGYDNDLKFTNAIKTFDKATFDLLYAENATAAEDPIIPEGTPWNFEAIPAPAPPSERVVDTFTNPRSTLTPPNPDNGSNNWAVSGAKTLSGKPILANDPHLGLNLPSVWYEIQLNNKGLNVYGASLPGAPGVIIGFNDSISWGVTNAGRYVKDWYKINFKDINKSEYKYENEWLKTRKVIEEIKIKGQPSFYDTVYYTIHGPVVYDQNFYHKNETFGYALRWLAHDPSLEILTFYYLNRAKNYDQYVDALKYYSCPAQNFVFASASGDIAMWIAGKFPVKWKDQGRFLMEGTQKENTWQTYIPFEHSPHVLNPPRNFVSSANQHPVDSTYPYNAFEGDFEYYRNRRINNVLRTKDSLSVEDFMSLQNDNFNLMASESLPIMLSHLEKENLSKVEREYYNILQQWDFINTKESLAAPVYQVLWDTLFVKIWDEINTSTIPLPYPEFFTTIKLIKNNPQHFIFNISETSARENAFDLITQSFKGAVKKIEKIKKEHSIENLAWSTFKATRIRHLLRPINAFHTDTLMVGGNKGIVNAIGTDHGPSWRMIVQLGEEIEAYGVYPGGQSGNPGSPYYDNFIDTWANGKYYNLVFLHNDKDKSKEIVFTQSINRP
ncbi:MAG TPA: penicillin acylase family protein [Cytophagales bacterium]|nr:penicillin acylase family protein [Cytophagales bacterium]